MPFFAIDQTALILAIPFALLCILLYRKSKNFSNPEILVSTLTRFFSSDSSPITLSWKERLQWLPYILKLIALGAFLLAFLDPRLHFEHKGINDNKQPPPHEKLATEGIAMYLVLDQSGSMAEEVNSRLPNGQLVRMSKVELLKKVTAAFIQGDPQYGLEGRPNDLIGLVEFARTAHVIVPLTLDRKVLLDKLNAFNVVPDSAQDGTAIGYALLKTINLIAATRNYSRDLIGQGKPAYEIKNFVIILVTDGLQDPNPLDKESRWRNIDPREVALAAKEQNTRIYIVNVEPSMGTEAFAPNRRQLQQAAETTGGKFFIVDSTTDLPEIYASIDKLEKSPLPYDEEMVKRLKESIAKEKLPGIYDTFFLAPYLIAFGLISLFLGILLGSLLLRKVP
jgi:Ca-activated chloride channel family protein